jgi:four helix bundle protein
MALRFTIAISMDKNIKQKSREFAVKTVMLHKQLSSRKKESVMSEELLRTGAGVGSELAKADCAMGKNDQIAKVYKALQNCAESRYWLELLNDTDYLTEFEFNDTLKDCDEMGKLLIALLKSMRAASPS